MANVVKKHSISSELAHKMVDEAVAKAREVGVSENVAILDDGGNLKAYLSRHSGRAASGILSGDFRTIQSRARTSQPRPRILLSTGNAKKCFQRSIHQH